MPFLHWFKKTPSSAEAEGDTSENPVFGKVELAPVFPAALDPEPHKEEIAHVPEEEKPDSEVEASPETRTLDTVTVSSTAEVSAQATDSIPAEGEKAYLSAPIGAFYGKLPAHLLASKKPSLNRTIQFAKEDAVIDDEAQKATLPLSILSLSCPDIFSRAVEPADDGPISFSIAAFSDAAETPVNEVILGQTIQSEAHEIAGNGANEIKVRLQPIIADLPLDLEPHTIELITPGDAEVSLPLDAIKAQLPNGRVTVPASTFIAGLPSDLRPLFEKIDPAAEIPIPLQEIFPRLPADAIEIRKDQESDHFESKLPTPFGDHAEEDAKRFAQSSAETGSAAVKPPEEVGSSKSDAIAASEKLQALFMTDEPLDLRGTLLKVAELPGLQSCALTTTDGQKLAGGFGDPHQEKLFSTLFPDLFERTHTAFDELRTGTLETITLYAGVRQFSGFVRGKLCLAVVHDNRPFKPGVREKIQAVLNELEALSATAKPS